MDALYHNIYILIVLVLQLFILYEMTNFLSYPPSKESSSVKNISNLWNYLWDRVDFDRDGTMEGCIARLNRYQLKFDAKLPLKTTLFIYLFEKNSNVFY